MNNVSTTYLMTIKDAIEAGAKSVRKSGWNPTAKLELPPMTPHGRGPWCHLHDIGQVIPVLLFNADDGEIDWEVVE